MTLENKTAVITGAANGIGYAIAERFLRERARVILSDIDDKAGREAEKHLRKIGKVKYVHCDVAQKLDVHNLIAGAIEEFDRIDILVNNAAIFAKTPFLELTEDQYDHVMDTNLKGAFLCSQAVSRHMIDQVEAGENPGCIINISSVNALLAVLDQIPYSISKSGINQMTRGTSLALSKYGIRVNAIGPGSIETNMLESVTTDPDIKSMILSRTPMGRFGKTEEIAGIAAFLASDDASYVTGQVIYADGGRMSLNYVVDESEG